MLHALGLRVPLGGGHPRPIREKALPEAVRSDQLERGVPALGGQPGALGAQSDEPGGGEPFEQGFGAPVGDAEMVRERPGVARATDGLATVHVL